MLGRSEGEGSAAELGTGTPYLSFSGVADGDTSAGVRPDPEHLSALADWVSPEGGHPFERSGLLRRVLPFALVSVLAEASLVLSAGSALVGEACLSVVLLGMVAGALFLPWNRWPAWLTVLVPLVDVAFVLTLILATGTSTSGAGLIVLVPLIWTALYHRRWESFVVVGAIAVTTLITSLIPVQVADVVLLRRMFFWVALGSLISVATHALRDRLLRSIELRETSLQRTVAFAAAAEELTTLLDPDEVLATAVRLAAQLASSPGNHPRRAQYNRIEGGMIHVVAQHDEAGLSITAPFPLAEQPNIVEVLRTGVTTQCPLDTEAVGPIVRVLIKTLGVTHSVYIPVHLGGEIDGVLSVPLRGSALGPDLVDFCRAFGHLVELALRNADAHQVLQEQATTDDLTGLPNRRAFDRLMTNRPGRMGFSILAVDLDGLKPVNDTLGHRAGDEMLVQAARAMQGALRNGDVVARIGGDEFAVFLFEAERTDAELVAMRILDLVGALPSSSLIPSLSIGIASGKSGSDPLEVLSAADGAMYRAKAFGGGQFVVAEPVDANGPVSRGTPVLQSDRPR